MSISSFISKVCGPEFDRDQYIEELKQDLSRDKPLEEVAYRYKTRRKAERIAYDILSVVIFPIGLYRLAHRGIGKVVVLASACTKAQSRRLVTEGKDQIVSDLAGDLGKEHDLIAKRISIQVGSRKVDAMIFGKRENLNNGRWILHSNGNGGYFERYLGGSMEEIVEEQVDSLGANLLMYNYRGVGASEGSPTRRGLKKEYRAMLKCLEDEIGAKEIVGWGHSLGGGVQANAIENHSFKDDVRYVFVKDRTYGKMVRVVQDMVKNFTRFRLGWRKESRALKKGIKTLMHGFGWKHDSTASSRRLAHPEVIIQAGAALDLTRAEDVWDDGVISERASHARPLLEDGNIYGNKVFIGSDANFEGHGGSFWPSTVRAINKAIKKGLSRQSRNVSFMEGRL